MKTFNRFLIVGLILFFPSLCFAHPGRIDGNGGHRVNKPYSYDARYIEIIDGKTHYKDGIVKFKKGDYHFHVHPGKNGRQDGIYVPAKDRHESEKYKTDDVVISACTVVASKDSNVYHNPDSGYVRNIKEENVVIFNNADEAKKEGYQPSEFYKKCQ